MTIKALILVIVLGLSTACSTTPIPNNVIENDASLLRDKMNHSIQDVLVNLLDNQCSQTDQKTVGRDPWLNNSKSWLINPDVNVHTLSISDQQINYILQTKSGAPLVDFEIQQTDVTQYSCQFTLRVLSARVMVLTEEIDNFSLWQDNQGWTEIDSFLNAHQKLAAAPQSLNEQYSQQQRPATSDFIEFVSSDLGHFLIESMFCLVFQSNGCHHSSRTLVSH